MANFTQTLTDETWEDLKVWAKIRGCTKVQELIRTVIIPDWQAMQGKKKN